MLNTDIQLEERLDSRLKALSLVKERPPYSLAKLAIEEYVTREEKYELEKYEDKMRWQRYQLTGYNIPHEKVLEWLASWGNENELPCPK